MSNLNLRGNILEKSLSLEGRLAELMKLILRIPSKDTKTLSNKSTALSFKVKVDLLYDLGEFTKQDYNCFIKFMEVRNQFIHNSECNDWFDFEAINRNASKFIRKEFSNESGSFSESFRDLYSYCLDKLEKLYDEYSAGIAVEVEKAISYELLLDIGKYIEGGLAKLQEIEIEFENLEVPYREKWEFIYFRIKQEVMLNLLIRRNELVQFSNRISLQDLFQRINWRLNEDNQREYLSLLDSYVEFTNSEYVSEEEEYNVIRGVYISSDIIDSKYPLDESEE